MLVSSTLPPPLLDYYHPPDAILAEEQLSVELQYKFLISTMIPTHLNRNQTHKLSVIPTHSSAWHVDHVCGS